jgi:hypothetical protein
MSHIYVLNNNTKVYISYKILTRAEARIDGLVYHKIMLSSSVITVVAPANSAHVFGLWRVAQTLSMDQGPGASASSLHLLRQFLVLRANGGASFSE